MVVHSRDELCSFVYFFFLQLFHFSPFEFDENHSDEHLRLSDVFEQNKLIWEMNYSLIKCFIMESIWIKKDI